MYKGAMDPKANAPQKSGGKTSTADTANTAAPRWRGGSGASDPYSGSKRAEGSSGATTFVGRKGEPGRKDYACPAPVLGFQTSGLHGHLGHFKATDVLEKGHNEGLYVGNRRGASVLRDPDAIGRRSARRAIKAGNTGVAAERPVLAARLAARSSGASRKETRAAVKAARQDPNSARSERKARRTLKKPTPTVPRDSAGNAMY